MRSLAILGVGGSIGSQTVDIVRQHLDRFSLCGMTIHSRAEQLFALAREFRPRACGIVVPPEEIPSDLRHIEWFFGEDCNQRVVEAAGAEDVLTAVVGAAGLPASLSALHHAKRLLLANKEALVTGGSLVMDLAKQLGKPILPVDSEHSAIFQCLQERNGNAPQRLWITASGGPFRTWTTEAMSRATVADVLRHPTWNMGRKITVDSATMVNKGLEVIEASHLFAMPEEQISVLVHPQSIVHSLVEFADGCVLAQLGVPDMHAPIAYALSYPERLPAAGQKLDLAQAGNLSFFAPDDERFPALPLARHVLRAGGTAPCIFNGANEVAVEAFLDGAVPFGAIVPAIEETLSRLPSGNVMSVEHVYEADAQARCCARAVLVQRM